MKRLLVSLALAASLGFPQSKPELSDAEQEALSSALAEAGSSPVEFLRAIEKHLAKYPDSPRRPDLERAALRAAMEAKDEKRIVLYGERVLAREDDDIQILERVTRSLVAAPGKENSERGLKYARRIEQLVAEMRKDGDTGRMSKAEWQDEIDRAEGRALTFQARAQANLGRPEEALALARRAWETWASAESAREVARSLERTGKPAEAVVYLANAFTIPDPRNTDEDRARDRAKMGELYRAAKGSEAGLGDVVLQAYDRTTELIHQHKLRARASDPNSAAKSALEFTLSAVEGGNLSLATLRGKTIVFDFWATWCGPCRAQHPLYEQVKKRFRGNDGVVFLSVSTDEEREAVKPFLEEMNWKDRVYFDDGLARALRISSIPTTIVLDKRGEVFSRMNGYVPGRFVDMLSERIQDALAN